MSRGLFLSTVILPLSALLLQTNQRFLDHHTATVDKTVSCLTVQASKCIPTRSPKVRGTKESKMAAVGRVRLFKKVDGHWFPPLGPDPRTGRGHAYR
jgi:hypothetical protein